MRCCYLSVVILVTLFHRITSMTTRNSLSNESRVEPFKMSGKQLTEIPAGNTSIEEVDLAYNHLTSLPANSFQLKLFKEIRNLDLHQNMISSVNGQAFHGLKRLKNVDMSFNQITELDPYTFEQSRRLEKLDLSNNRIKFSKSRIFLVSLSMRTLILTKNNISELHELAFVGLKHLTNLILDDNTLDRIHSDAFKPLTTIQFLSLANTKVVVLSTSMFTQVPRVLNIESSPLANKFDPPLTRLRGIQVTTLLETDTSRRKWTDVVKIAGG